MVTAGIVPGVPERHGYSSVIQGDRVVLGCPVTGAGSDMVPMNDPMASAPPAYYTATTMDQYPAQPAAEAVPVNHVDDRDGVSTGKHVTCVIMVMGIVYILYWSTT